MVRAGRPVGAPHHVQGNVLVHRIHRAAEEVDVVILVEGDVINRLRAEEVVLLHVLLAKRICAVIQLDGRLPVTPCGGDDQRFLPHHIVPLFLLVHRGARCRGAHGDADVRPTLACDGEAVGKARAAVPDFVLPLAFGRHALSDRGLVLRGSEAVGRRQLQHGPVRLVVVVDVQLHGEEANFDAEVRFEVQRLTPFRNRLHQVRQRLPPSCQDGRRLPRVVPMHEAPYSRHDVLRRTLR
mmetsp:Transcript_110287/g.317257  ORF Transcript_110287/g.317257 Transcript_110287/m.317257 type:complete len:239 (-) Transcript_110287:368-1084(-)